MHICLVSKAYPPETGFGGIATYVYDLSHALRDLGHSIVVVSMTFGKERVTIENGIKVYRLNINHSWYKSLNAMSLGLFKKVLYNVRLHYALRKILEEENIEIVEAPNWEGEAFVYSFFKKIPLVVRLSTPAFKAAQINAQSGIPVNKLTYAIANWMEKWSILNADAIISNSEANRDTIEGEYGNLRKPVFVIPHGIRVATIGEEAVYEARSCRKSIDILYVGRQEPRKGFQVLVGAIPRVVVKHPEVRFIVIGEDIQFNKIDSYRKYCLSNIPKSFHEYIDFKGFISSEELERHYRTCDIFVAPSLYESFGLIYIEAMQYGKPVIGCNIGGVPEVIDDGFTGFLVEPGESVALADRICELIEDEQKRREMGARARKAVLERFTRERMAKATIQVYEALLASQEGF